LTYQNKKIGPTDWVFFAGTRFPRETLRGRAPERRRRILSFVLRSLFVHAETWTFVPYVCASSVLTVGICRGVSYRHRITLYQSGSVLQAIFKHSQHTQSRQAASASFAPSQQTSQTSHGTHRRATGRRAASRHRSASSRSFQSLSRTASSRSFERAARKESRSVLVTRAHICAL
jgi:hypothetical protein